MINRRSLVSVATVGVAATIGAKNIALAQESSEQLPLQNASFIRDQAEIDAGTPAATAVASPSPGEVEEEFLGYIIGDPEAPNTLQVYADYRCPHCRVFHTDIEPGLISDFVQDGRMNIEIIDFTVIGVPSFDALGDDSIESVQAAEAAACAAEQDAYLNYREWLYDGEPTTNDGDFSDENLIGAAEELGLNVDQFSDALLNGVYEDSIIAVVTLGINNGVQGTPTMILNGGEPFYVPNNGYDGLKEIIEEQLQ